MTTDGRTELHHSGNHTPTSVQPVTSQRSAQGGADGFSQAPKTNLVLTVLTRQPSLSGPSPSIQPAPAYLIAIHTSDEIPGTCSNVQMENTGAKQILTRYIKSVDLLLCCVCGRIAKG